MIAKVRFNKWISFQVRSKADGRIAIKRIGQHLGTIAILTKEEKLVALYEISIDKNLRPKVVRV